MKRSRFTEEQIIGILREQEAGMKTAYIMPGSQSETGCGERAPFHTSH